MGDLVVGHGVIEVWVDGDCGMSQLRGRTSVIACLAGPVAELRLRHPGYALTVEDMSLNLHKPDESRAAELLGSSNPYLLIECWREAERLVAAHGHAVSAITEALSLRGRLTGDEAEALWREASGAA